MKQIKHFKFFYGPVHMQASQTAYRAGALCRDLTAFLIPMQTLISVHMSRRAGLLSEISLEYWRDLGRWDEISIPATETRMSLLLMR